MPGRSCPLTVISCCGRGRPLCQSMQTLLTIVLGSGLLRFWQERSATDAMEKLLAIVQFKALEQEILPEFYTRDA